MRAKVFRLLQKSSLLVVFVLLLFSLPEVMDDLSHQVQGFRAAQGDYARVLPPYPLAINGLIIRKVLPPEAVIELSHPELSMATVSLRYLIYPIRIAKEGGFLLYQKGDQPIPPLDWDGYRISDEYSIYAKPGHAFVARPIPFPSYRIEKAILWVFFFGLINLLAGNFCLRLLCLEPRDLGLMFFGALSYLLGYLLLTGLLWVFLLLGGLLTRTTVLLLWGTVVGLLAWMRSKVPQSSCAKGVPWEWQWNFVVDVFMFFLAGAVFTIAVTRPVVDWDGLSHWIMKAKVFTYVQGLNFDYTHHNIYPILWPLNIAAQFVVAGEMFDALAQWTSGLFLVVFLIQFQKGLTFYVPRPYRALIMVAFLLAFLNVPGREGGTFQNFVKANAENMLLAFIGAMTTVFLAWLRTRKISYLFLAMALGMGVTLSKLEGGIIFFIALSGIWLCDRGKKFPLTEKLIFTAGGMILLLPLGWMKWVEFHGFGSGMIHTQTGINLEKTSWLLLINFHYLISCMVIYVCLGLFIYFLFFPKKSWDNEQVFLALLGMGMVVFSFFANIGLPLEEIKTMFPEAFPRLFLHAVPVVTLFCVSRVRTSLKERKAS